MSCHGGTHFSCECQRELLENAVEALKELVNGIEDYKDSIAIIDRVKLGKFIYSLPSAKSIIRRHSKI